MRINEIDQVLEEKHIESAIKICPQCGYERKKNDSNFISSNECPKCGIFYNKWDPSAVSKNMTHATNTSKNKMMQLASLETKSARILLGILFTPITIGIAFLSAVGLALGMITIQDGFRRDFMDDFVGGFLFLIIAPLPMVVIVGTWLRMLKKYEAMSKKMIKFVRGCLICGVALSMVGFVVSLCFAIAILLHFIPAYRGAELELGISSILFLFVAYIFYFLLLKGTPKVHNSITRR